MDFSKPSTTDGFAELEVSTRRIAFVRKIIISYVIVLVRNSQTGASLNLRRKTGISEYEQCLTF